MVFVRLPGPPPVHTPRTGVETADIYSLPLPTTSPNSTAFPSVAYSSFSASSVRAASSSPPAYIPRVAFPQGAHLLTALVNSPKFCAFPVVAVVINSTTFDLFGLNPPNLNVLVGDDEHCSV